MSPPQALVTSPRRVPPAGDSSRFAFEPHQTAHRERMALHAQQPYGATQGVGGSLDTTTHGGHAAYCPSQAADVGAGGGAHVTTMAAPSTFRHHSPGASTAAAYGFMDTAPADGFLHLPGQSEA